MSDSRSEFANLSGAYALDALSEHERARFEKYLVGDDEMRAEAMELQDTAVYLGLATVPEQPSAQLRDRLMGMLDSVPQEPARNMSPVLVPLRPAEARARQRWYRNPAATLVSVAAAAALILGGGIAIQNVAQASQVQQAQNSTISKIYAASDYQSKSAKVNGGGTAKLIWSVSMKKSALVVDGVNNLASSKTYELWYISSAGKATPAGTFEGGDSAKTVPLTGNMSVGDFVGVTIEPAGGSEQPTSKPVLAISTSA